MFLVDFVWAQFDPGLPIISFGAEEKKSMGAAKMGEAIRHNWQATQLHLPDLTGEEMFAVAPAIANHRYLTHISLGGTSFGSQVAISLANALKHHPSITSVNLADCNIDSSGACAFAGMLKTNWVLKELNLCRNKIGDDVGPAFAEAFRVNTTLTDLWFQSSPIGDNSVRAWLLPLSNHNRTLKTLGVQFCKIGHQGANAIAEMMKKNRVLDPVSLCGNPIGDQGAASLVLAYDIRKVKSIDLGFMWFGCSVNFLDNSPLADALKNTRNVTSIRLSGNMIKDESAALFAEVLKVNRSLKHVGLEHTFIGELGAEALAEALKVNTTLEDLGIYDTGLRDYGWGYYCLYQASKINKKVKIRTSFSGTPCHLKRAAQQEQEGWKPSRPGKASTSSIVCLNLSRYVASALLLFAITWLSVWQFGAGAGEEL
ncbi:MAG: hypothetical protein AB7F31_07005 [Parachlamydiales bacterium]